MIEIVNKYQKYFLGGKFNEIKCAAVDELGLEVGSDAYAVIKATNVMVGIDE